MNRAMRSNASKGDPYLSPQFQPDTLDTFLVRRAILNALQAQLKHFHGVVLDVGCGNQPYRPLLLAPPSKATSYIGLDIPGTHYTSPNVFWEGRIMPLADNTVDSALITEVLEHCPEPERLLAEVRRVLKPGGFVFLTVPFLWPLHDVPHDEYRYTPFALQRHLRAAGFSRIELKPLGGWDASLAQLLGLWVRRRPMSLTRRAVLERLLMPAIRALMVRDQPCADFFESCMITGLSSTARKPSVD